MLELDREDFYKIKPLLEGGHLHPEIMSVIEHHNPGWIFADEMNQPRSALVWSKGIQGFYLIGDHTNEAFIHGLDGFIRSTIEPRMREASLSDFEVSGHHAQWDFESIFPARELYKFEQLVLKRSKIQQTTDRPGIDIINLKSDPWEDQELQNRELIDRHIGLFWSSPEEFRQKGFGYAAVDGNEVIGVCYSSFVTDDTHAIGIETVPSSQNKGVGTHLGRLVVEDLLQNEFIPYWDCSLDNESSRKLAERLGFELVHRYTVCSFEV